jgi:hypothetical protein
MQLDLVEGGGDAGLVYEPFELILGEVRDAGATMRRGTPLTTASPGSASTMSIST